jgi:uncharacterized protein with NRDE domain
MKHHLSSQRPPDVESLMQILQDRARPPDKDLPRTGVGLEWERRLGAVFIHSAIYGTRASTVLLVACDGTTRICERAFDPDGFTGEVAQTFTMPAKPPGGSSARP